MTPEVIIALLSSPLLVAIPTLFLRWRESQHKRKAAMTTSTLTRLEAENVRLSEQIKAAEKRIEELEFQEDLHREEIHALRERIAVLRRRMVELGVSEVADG